MAGHPPFDAVPEISTDIERIEVGNPKNEKSEEARAVDVPLEDSAEPEANEPTGVEKHTKSSQIAWLAIVAFILSVACICGSIFVIVHSDGRQTSQWIPYAPAVQPAVLLAIFSGTFNAAQTIALSEGIVISWWTCAARGTSLSSLHYIWNKGEWKSPCGLMKALSEPKVIHIFLAALVSMATSIADGPLLQRSSDTIVGEVVTHPEWDWTLPTTIPDGLTGIVDRTAPANLTASDDLQWAVQNWYANKTMIDNGNPPCDGVCYADVVLPGVSVSCTSEEKVIDLSTLEQSDAILFDVRYARFDDGNTTPILTIETLFAKEVTSACEARIHIDTCNYTAAIVQYKLVFDRRVMRLNLTQPPRVAGAMPLPGDSFYAKNGTGAGALAGLGWLAQYYLLSNTTIHHEPADPKYFWENQGVLANQYIDIESDYRCVPKWRSPTNYIVQGIHEVMFRLVWYSPAYNGTNPISLKAPVRQQTRATKYQSKLGPMAAAVAMMGITTLATATLLWPGGFKGIKRPVSLSPLETAIVLADAMNGLSTRPEISDRDYKDVHELVSEVHAQGIRVDLKWSVEAKGGTLSFLKQNT